MITTMASDLPLPFSALVQMNIAKLKEHTRKPTFQHTVQSTIIRFLMSTTNSRKRQSKKVMKKHGTAQTLIRRSFKSLPGDEA